MSNKYREAEFLPSVLEIVETPPSPTLRWTYWLIILFLCLAATWAYFGKIDIVVVARGQTISDGQFKIVQASDAGSVTRIIVADGDLVKAGDALIELDRIGQSNDLEALQSELARAEAEAALNEALLQDDPLRAFEAASITDPALRRETSRLIQDRSETHGFELRQLEEARLSLLSEQKEVGILITQLEQTMPLLRQQVLSSGTLGDTGSGGQTAILQLRSELLSKQAEQKAAAETLKRLGNQVTQLGAERDALKGRFRANAAERAQIAAARAEQLSFDIREQERLVGKGVLSAPVDGYVHELKVHTIGAVIAVGQEVMSIIPSDLPLIAEIAIENKDVGFAKEGDLVELKFDAFPFTKYGVMGGVLSTVARSSEELDGASAVFKASVTLDQQIMQAEETAVPLSPGMTLSADIKTGERRIAEYFLSPLLRYRDEVLRER